MEKLEGRKTLLLQSTRENLDRGNRDNSGSSPEQTIHGDGNIMNSSNTNTKHNNNQRTSNGEVGGVSPTKEGFGEDNDGNDGKFRHLIDTNRIVLKVGITTNDSKTLYNRIWERGGEWERGGGGEKEVRRGGGEKREKDLNEEGERRGKRE